VSHRRPWGMWITWFGFACVVLARVGAKTTSQAAFDAVLALLLLVLANRPDGATSEDRRPAAGFVDPATTGNRPHRAAP